MAAWRPASVVIGRALKMPMMTAVSASMPNHFGEAATLATGVSESGYPAARCHRPGLSLRQLRLEAISTRLVETGLTARPRRETRSRGLQFNPMDHSEPGSLRHLP